MQQVQAAQPQSQQLLQPQYDTGTPPSCACDIPTIITTEAPTDEKENTGTESHDVVSGAGSGSGAPTAYYIKGDPTPNICV